MADSGSAFRKERVSSLLTKSSRDFYMDEVRATMRECGAALKSLGIPMDEGGLETAVRRFLEWKDRPITEDDFRAAAEALRPEWEATAARAGLPATEENLRTFARKSIDKWLWDEHIVIERGFPDVILHLDPSSIGWLRTMIHVFEKALAKAAGEFPPLIPFVLVLEAILIKDEADIIAASNRTPTGRVRVESVFPFLGLRAAPDTDYNWPPPPPPPGGAFHRVDSVIFGPDGNWRIFHEQKYSGLVFPSGYPSFDSSIQESWPGLPADMATGGCAVLPTWGNACYGTRTDFFGHGKWVQLDFASGQPIQAARPLADRWPALRDYGQPDAIFWSPQDPHVRVFVNGGKTYFVMDYDSGQPASATSNTQEVWNLPDWMLSGGFTTFINPNGKNLWVVSKTYDGIIALDWWTGDQMFHTMSQLDVWPGL